MSPTARVWTVHVTLSDEVRPTAAVFTTEAQAHAYAADVSTDEEVLAASVVAFTLDALGTRNNVAMYVRRARQALPYLSDRRDVFGGGRKKH